ncbi:dTDP-glucose 4,6-dehydratase [Gammaproteobacteria bacterium]|nr:dTDP-glucose 4,6-dehydratase [Gammaproteobacteria bacterium]MDB9842375.1 dTDP-glucose 4,6-dehydratase [Gammaproteobacteria bacterium]
MKILITGGAGFIGSALIREAVSRKFSVLNVDALTYASSTQSLESISQDPLYTFSNTNIKDLNALTKIFDQFVPDAVMHLAAETHVDKSIDAPTDFIETNVVGTFNILQAAYKFWLKQNKPPSFRFLHVSTDEVYGSLGEDGYFTELTKYDPSSPYSASKASSDHLVKAWGMTYGLPILLTNCSNNYGPFQFPEKLIPVVVNKALSGESIPIYGSGKNIRDWLYVEDHVDALLSVLFNGSIGRAYNIGGNSEKSNIELVTQICKILNILRPSDNRDDYVDQINFVPDRPGHDMRYAIDTTRIHNELEWSPKHTFEEGLRKTIIWYLDNEDWWRTLLRKTQLNHRQGNLE